MPEHQNWIDEREAIRLFKPGGKDTSDAVRLLQHNATNRDITQRQGVLFTVSRVLADVTGFDFYNELPTELEKVQANIDDVARHDYMKVAIEQWQGKIQSAKSKNVEAMT
jgi:hypothetical protein